ncbi:terpene cyclase [Penicillium cataractarum]|uniref:(2E,6E)-farnesyl diphosphate synthase n=1 Tax=Penicillium cataractarum TaxID=2100454 RepID=A0A9W9SL61_9EURO|nr:terpene cyclase [Penicillium cataractarum]KAJ5379965.1 terpene cyclase [Penicillium cataractarum]
MPSTASAGSSLKDVNPFSRPKSHSIFHHGAEIEQQNKFRQEKIISAPLDYLGSLPGKDIRGKLISAFNEWFKIPEEKLEVIKRVVGLLHVASLLIDDIQDSSKLRRGLPVAHNIFGVAQTINSANYAYFRAQSELFTLGKPQALDIFTEELLRLHRGQGMDLYWRDSLICPTEEEYLEMVANKTGGLFRLAIKLIQLESENTMNCVPLVDLLGVIFQIRDDYQNLQSDQYAKNKGFGEDITEGKFSYPIIHSIRQDHGNPQLMNILRQKTEDEDVKRYTIQIIESTGSFEFTRQKLISLTTQARAVLKSLGVDQSSGLASILEFLELKQ